MISPFELKENTFETPKQGFYRKSEIINGRIAMFALPIIIFIELITKQSLFTLFNFGH